LAVVELHVVLRVLCVYVEPLHVSLQGRLDFGVDYGAVAGRVERVGGRGCAH